MGLLEECDTHFKSKDLYEVLGLKHNATPAEIKKAYRQMSLKVHPDREHDSDKKDLATKRFQTLSKVHFILSDKDQKGYYDETGCVLEDGTSADRDWEEYWRIVFPKITIKDIENFYKRYRGSSDERDDLRKMYINFEGDLDVIYEFHIGYDEDAVCEILDDMIAAKEIPALDKYVKEPANKKEKRLKRIEKEKKAAEAEEARRRAAGLHITNGSDDEEDSEDVPVDDLVATIQQRSAANFNSLIASLEAKYGKPPARNESSGGGGGSGGATRRSGRSTAGSGSVSKRSKK